MAYYCNVAKIACLSHRENYPRLYGVERSLFFSGVSFSLLCCGGTIQGLPLLRYESAAGKRPQPLVVPAADPVPLGSSP